jgi:hypothetical protein
MARFVVLDPTAEPEEVPAAGLAPRPASLAGLRVGLLDNGKLNSNVTLDLVAALIAEREPTIEVFRLRKPSSAKPLPADMVEAARARCDVVVAGIGD